MRPDFLIALGLISIASASAGAADSARNSGYDFTVLPEGDAVAKAYDVYGTPGVDVLAA